MKFKDRPERPSDITDEIRRLYEDCMEKLRRRDPVESWEAINARIAELNRRLDELDERHDTDSAGRPFPHGAL